MPAPRRRERAAPRGLQRWLPRSLFGRLLLVLAGGLLVAQLLSAAINVAERDRLLSSSFGMQPAQRIADVVRPARRRWAKSSASACVAVFRVPPLVLSLHRGAARRADAGGIGLARRRCSRRGCAPRWATTGRCVSRRATATCRRRPGRQRRACARGTCGAAAMWRRRRHDGPRARRRGRRRAHRGAAARRPLGALRHRTAGGAAGAALAAGADAGGAAGQRAGAVLRRGALGRAAAAAADRGRRRRWARTSIARPCPRTARARCGRRRSAFNTMQQRLAAFIDDRTRMLTALSHDLKTPLTRMRLRADLLDDDEQRLRFESDLKEMEAMVTQTLEFMRGLGGNEPRQPVDMMALLAALQADQQAMGRAVRDRRPGRSALRRRRLAAQARAGQPGRQRRALRRPRHGARRGHARRC